MRSYRAWSITTLVLCGCSLALAGDERGSGGRLVTGCVDRSIQPEFCQSVVRYRAKDTPALPSSTELTAEQRAVQSSLAADYVPVQPAQIQGSRASILVQRGSGEFAVLFLAKRDGNWSVVSVSDPTPAVRR